ncbi:hypothetical protein ACIA8D_26030, partial [Streptomyces sp. NPDC051684]
MTTLIIAVQRRLLVLMALCYLLAGILPGPGERLRASAPHVPMVLLFNAGPGGALVVGLMLVQAMPIAGGAASWGQTAGGNVPLVVAMVMGSTLHEQQQRGRRARHRLVLPPPRGAAADPLLQPGAEARGRGGGPGTAAPSARGRRLGLVVWIRPDQGAGPGACDRKAEEGGDAER